MKSVRASLSRLVFKAATFRAATAKLQGRDRLLFALKANRDGLRSKPLHARLSVTILPKKRHVSLTPTGKSAFLTHLQRQARPCSLSDRTKEQRLAPRPRKATNKDTFSPDSTLSTV